MDRRLNSLLTTIPFSFGLDLASTLLGGQAFRWRREDEGYYGVLQKDIVWLRESRGNIEVHSADSSSENLVGRLKSYLRLDDDFEAIRRTLDIDPIIHRALLSMPGLRLVRQDPWECLASFLCSSVSNVPRIRQTIEAIAEAYGERLFLGSYDRCSFPTAEQLTGVNQEEFRLRGAGFRAPYLAAAVRVVAKGELDLNTLRHVPYEEARRRLMGIPGVGEKIADCVCLYSLDKLEAFPIDRWVRRSLEERYVGSTHRSYRNLAQWANYHFGAYCGYAQLYLFHLYWAAKSPY